MPTSRFAAPGITVEFFSHQEGVHPNTYRYWEKRGLAPRRKASGPNRWKLIEPAELAAWRAKRAADQEATGQWWLRTPLLPLSWLSESEIEAHRMAFALLPLGRRNPGRGRANRSRPVVREPGNETAASGHI
jgi:hypothetical protein